MFEDNKRSKKNKNIGNRRIDLLVDEVYPWWKKTFILAKKKEIKTWKGLLIIFFIAGLAVALIWSVDVDFGFNDIPKD